MGRVSNGSSAYGNLSPAGASAAAVRDSSDDEQHGLGRKWTPTPDGLWSPGATSPTFPADEPDETPAAAPAAAASPKLPPNSQGSSRPQVLAVQMRLSSHSPRRAKAGTHGPSTPRQVRAGAEGKLKVLMHTPGKPGAKSALLWM